MINSFFLSLIISLINGISVLKFYQIKDYLLKRARAHFFLESAKRIVFNFKEYFLWFLFLCSFCLNFYFDLSQINYRSEWLMLVLVILAGWRLSFLKKINFTPKAIIVFFLALGINFLILYSTDNHFLTLTVLAPWPSQFIIFTLAIIFFNLISKTYLIWLGNKVKKKIDQYPDLKIIGLVGSYGKSTTKEFLVQLLNKNFKVLTTPPRINHEIALLKFILKSKLENYDYLVIEFGSYYLGNVKWATKFITPNIAYVTGITQQHLFLFGNIENIIKGEGTEILTWMKKGVLLINKNHEYFEKLKNQIDQILEVKKDIKVYTYGLKGDFSYQILENNLEKSVFELKWDDKSLILETNKIFPMQIENLSAALAYISLIDNLQDYKNIIRKLELPKGFLKLNIKNNLYIFDDSYNANPKGVMEALKFFKELSIFDYKLIIFNGLFELGEEARKIYSKLADEFLAFDKIILTSIDYYQILKEVLKNKIFIAHQPQEIKLFLESLSKKRVGIWIFNRFPEKFNKLFLNNNF